VRRPQFAFSPVIWVCNSGIYSTAQCDRKKAPRPSNKFMLFRKDYVSKHPRTRSGSSHQLDINKEVKAAWGQLGESELRFWGGKAEEEKARHKLMYPDYTYQPVRKSKPKAVGNESQQQTSRLKPSEALHRSSPSGHSASKHNILTASTEPEASETSEEGCGMQAEGVSTVHASSVATMQTQMAFANLCLVSFYNHSVI